MGTHQNPAIDLLMTQIIELEQKVNAFRSAVNHLCEKDGVPPLFPEGNDSGKSTKQNAPFAQKREEGTNPPTTIKSDSFYGKKQQTAVREYLNIRKSQGNGPAKPTEILDGLRAGGYQVEAKTDEIALVGLRAMLRKASTVFHKLPNGTWGLREWYPHAKPSKENSGKSAPVEKDGGATDATAEAGGENEGENIDGPAEAAA